MAQSKPRTPAPTPAHPQLAADDQALELGGGEKEPLDVALERLKGELGGEAELAVSVYRVDRKGGTAGGGRTFCEAYPLSDIADEFSFQRRIRADWGGGTYRLITHNGKHYVLNREVNIADDPRQAPAAGRSDEIAELRDLVRQALTRPAETEETVLAKLKLYREALGPSSSSSPAADFMNGVKFARELLGGQARPADTLREVLGLINGAKELREQLEPEEKDTSLAGIGLELLQTVRALAGAGGSVPLPGAPGEPAALPAVAVPPQLAAPPVAPAPAAAVDPALAALRENVAALNVWAKMNADALEVAELVYSQAPDQVLAFLHVSSWFEQLEQLMPEVTPHAAWYRKVAARVLELEAEDDAEPPAAA